MRTVTVDQFEFEDPQTEEHLEIAIASRARFPFPDAESFLLSRVESEVIAKAGDTVKFDASLGYGLVREYLQRFAGIELPVDCAWPTHVLEDGPDTWELVLTAPDSFIHYVWTTSA
ncbi:hypothetical protein [Dyella sp. C11]|uniref:hypothetical protein n=1 Tax=Dyella sp. C11 TaxID=2126991 RepID=UPI000D65B2C9|nr:hypothetical protein [Dyella sp. C11]